MAYCENRISQEHAAFHIEEQVETSPQGVVAVGLNPQEKFCQLAIDLGEPSPVCPYPDIEKAKCLIANPVKE